MNFENRGRIYLTDVCDDYEMVKDLRYFKPGQTVECHILKIDNTKLIQCTLSTRSSRLSNSTTLKDPELTTKDIMRNSIHRGFVKSASNVGIFIRLVSFKLAKLNLINRVN